MLAATEIIIKLFARDILKKRSESMKKAPPRFLFLTAFTFVLSLLLPACGGSQKSSNDKTYYNIKFVSDDKIVNILTVKNGDNLSNIEKIDKRGYSFQGWYFDENTWEQPFIDNMAITSDIALYAKWSLTSYWITYELNGGEQNNNNPKSYTIESESLSLFAPFKLGYSFLGWKKNDNFVSSIDSNWLSNITLDAIWSTNSYSINYFLDGGTNNSSNPSFYNIENSSIVLTEPSKKGYTFEGWYSDSSLIDKITSIKEGSHGDINLYAKWSLISYSITYKGPGGENLDISGTKLPSSYTIEDIDLPLVTYSLKGYRFKNWTKNGLLISYIPSGSIGDLILQGQFDDTFLIRYVDSRFDKVNLLNPTIFNPLMEPINLLPLEDTLDYSFTGWINEDGTKVSSIDTSYGDDITLYATWEIKVDFSTFEYIVDESKNLCMLLGVKDKNITKLTIPSVFNVIMPGALNGLDKLEELSVEYIGYSKESSKKSNLAYFFGYSTNEVAGNNIPSSLKKITVRSGEIGEYALANLNHVREIIIDSSITNIGFYAFYNCSSLEEITLPVRLIPEDEIEAKFPKRYSDAYASSSTYYGIAGSMNGIVPYDSEKLLTVHLDGGVDSGFSMFDSCLGLSKVTIDNTNIHCGMFRKCKNMQDISIGANVKEIHAYSFSDCKSLTEFIIPDTVLGIGKTYTRAPEDGIRLGSTLGSMFYGSSLNRVVIGNGVESIPYGMLYYNAIKELTIGENVRHVSNRSFSSLPDDFVLINNSKHKEWTISGKIDVKFIKALLANTNAPEKMYFVANDRNYNTMPDSTYKTAYSYFLSLYDTELDENEKKKFVFYSKSNPYEADGDASIDNADIEYWYHEQGEDWYFKFYLVNPKMWVKP